MATRNQAWWKPDADVFVRCFRGVLADEFRSLFVRGTSPKVWWTIGEVCELLRMSWLNRLDVDGYGVVRFDQLPRRAQYSIARRVVRNCGHCLGSDSGREVRVYRLSDLRNV